MSYHIVQKIKIDENKVLITGADNNVWPRTPQERECIYLEKWQENGYPSLDIAILSAYESGNFQPGRQNKYTRALEVLCKMPEYEEFNWRCVQDTSEIREKRKKEFHNLMTKALVAKLPRPRYAITKEADEGVAYFKHRKNSHFCKWYYDKAKASLFRFQEDAETTKKYFTNSENWQVVEL